MNLQLLQESTQVNFQEMEAHGILFSWQHNLTEQLTKMPVRGSDAHEGFRMPQMVKEDHPEVYLESFEHLVTAAGWNVSQWAPQLGPLLTG